MTEAEAARFVEFARGSERGLMFLLWLHTGLRPAEFIGLRWDAIELLKDGDRSYGVAHVRETVVRQKGGGSIFSPPKTEKGRRPVYFPAWLYDDLTAHRARQDRMEYTRVYGFVFAARNGQPLLRHNIAKRGLKPLLKEAGLPEEFTLYTLRRSFASLLRRAGVSAKEVSEQMGHEHSNFTDDVYVTVYDSAKREMSDALERLISGAGGTQVAHTESEKIM